MEIIFAVIIAVLGWWVVHWLTAKRDLLDKRRDLRVSYLVEAYRRLEGASWRCEGEERYSDIESAIGDIQLLGTPRQARLARKFAEDFAAEGSATLDDLLRDLETTYELNLT